MEHESEELQIAKSLNELAKVVSSLTTSSIELAKIVWRLNRIFMTIAIGGVIVLLLAMVLLTLFISNQARFLNSEISKKLDERSQEIVERVMTIKQSQNVNIERSKTRDDLVEEQLHNSRQLKLRGDGK